MAIPKVIHQTWKTSEVPAGMAALARTWRRHHASWDYRLWTDDDNRAFVEEHYPWFLETYDGYPHPIQRVDAARYFILHHFGGLYVDLDFLSLRSIDPLLAGKTCILPLVSDAQAKLHARERIISNALMGAASGHPFLRFLIDRLIANADPKGADHVVLTTTGPFMLTDMYDEFRDASSVTLIPARRLFPLSEAEARAVVSRESLGEVFPDAYAVHLYAGTWWREEPGALTG